MERIWSGRLFVELLVDIQLHHLMQRIVTFLPLYVPQVRLPSFSLPKVPAHADTGNAAARSLILLRCEPLLDFTGPIQSFLQDRLDLCDPGEPPVSVRGV